MTIPTPHSDDYATMSVSKLRQMIRRLMRKPAKKGPLNKDELIYVLAFLVRYVMDRTETTIRVSPPDGGSLPHTQPRRQAPNTALEADNSDRSRNKQTRPRIISSDEEFDQLIGDIRSANERSDNGNEGGSDSSEYDNGE